MLLQKHVHLHKSEIFRDVQYQVNRYKAIVGNYGGETVEGSKVKQEPYALKSSSLPATKLHLQNVIQASLQGLSAGQVKLFHRSNVEH